VIVEASAITYLLVQVQKTLFCYMLHTHTVKLEVIFIFHYFNLSSHTFAYTQSLNLLLFPESFFSFNQIPPSPFTFGSHRERDCIRWSGRGRSCQRQQGGRWRAERRSRVKATRKSTRYRGWEPWDQGKGCWGFSVACLTMAARPPHGITVG
jgi:hypothetical protein